MASRVLSLIYHDVVPRHERDAVGFPGPVAGVYKLTPETFSAHLAAIAGTGVATQADRGRWRVMLTFDDGGASATRIATELEQHGLRGAFFIVTGRIGAPGFLGAASVRELVERGHVVGSHSHTHPPHMARLGPRELAAEWAQSRDVLGDLLGTPPVSAAVPGGSVSRQVVEQAARAGYGRLFTSTPRTAVRTYGTMAVIGRYTMWARDSPELAAAIVRGDVIARVRRRASWELKSGAKRVAPGLYDALRAARAARAGRTA